uniref:hypothetical protein n=1 Tax=Candidatus Electrothrix sp. TaxID=2170559 RepID=UPI004055CC9E
MSAIVVATTSSTRISPSPAAQQQQTFETKPLILDRHCTKQRIALRIGWWTVVTVSVIWNTGDYLSLTTRDSDGSTLGVLTINKQGSSFKKAANNPCHNATWIQPINPASSKPIWVASFPGSGAEMFRSFIESITGGEPGWSIYDTDHPGNQTCTEIHAATCKTHWPVLPMSPPTFQSNLVLYHDQAIVLLRNPLHAFPSRLNHQFEVINRRGYHTQQAPENVWNRWIRQHIHGQVDAYKDFVSTWTNATSPPFVALYVPYEGLVHPDTGWVWAKRIAHVLKDAHHAVPADQATLRCLWKLSILDRPTRKRAKHSYKPGYRWEEYQQLQALMDDIAQKAVQNTELYKILNEYNAYLNGNFTTLRED